MPDFRVHSPAPADGLITLPPGESHHLVAVNRARSGDTVVAFDGHGTEWTCELTDARKAGATLRVLATHTLPPLPCAVTLAQALPKGGAMDDIVRHATELGAARIVPLETGRTQVHLEGSRSDRKVEKWRVTALEAAKQCGNPFLPELAALQSLDSFLSGDIVRDAQLKLVASLHPGARPLRDCMALFRTEQGRPPESAVWLVGPEGDFSVSEMERIGAAGFQPVTLGPLVLRCDTAATVALGILSHETQP